MFKKIKLVLFDKLFIFKLFLLCFISVVYIHHHPTSVQVGDSAELASRAFTATVAHPPGYPLIIQLFRLANIFVEPNTFYSAISILNIGFSVLLIFVLFINTNVMGTLIVTQLAFSATFWRFSEIPEVFSLNSLFAGLTIIGYLKIKNGKTFYAPATLFLFTLALTNHLTIIFLAPLVLDILWIAKSNRKLFFQNLMALILGSIVFLSFYGSIIFLNPTHLLSWKNIENLPSLIQHFLRTDYGTFQLGAQMSTSTTSQFNTLNTFLKQCLFDYPLISLLFSISVFFTFMNKYFLKKYLFIVVSLGLYIAVFLTLSNVNIDGYMSEVILRFFILPSVMMTTLAALFIQDYWLQLKPKLQTGLILFCGFFAAYQLMLNYNDQDYSQNTVIEDYAINLMNMAPTEKPTFILLYTDTTIYATQYAYYVLQDENKNSFSKKLSNIEVISIHRLKNESYQNKLQKKFPQLKKIDITAHENDVYFLNRFMLANKLNFNFLFEKNIIIDNSQFEVTYKALGVIVSEGHGYIFDMKSFNLLSFRSNINDITGAFNEFNSYREVGLAYTRFWLDLGRQQLFLKNKTAAQAAFQSALKKVEYCNQCIFELCKLNQEAKSDERMCHNTSVQSLYNYD